MSGSDSQSSSTSAPRANDVKQFEPLAPTRTHTKHLWKFKLRPSDDDEPQDWWFASTAIPLLAATTGPLANVMSIAALITSWRSDYDPAYPGQDAHSIGFDDPHWCIGLNAASLACGFIGNIFLLFNFTRRVRYIVALPMTIILWYFATGIVSMLGRAGVFIFATFPYLGSLNDSTSSPLRYKALADAIWQI